jgi:hypothetical protein
MSSFFVVGLSIALSFALMMSLILVFGALFLLLWR